jgi:arylsulfatase A-like enzyme
MNERPHLLVIMTDQQSAAAMSCAGNADLNTPNMDRLAAAGVRFERTYSTFPLCGPFRACMITGRYPHQINAMTNGPRLDDAVTARSMGHLLRAAGYTTAYAGKWHVPSIDLVNEGERFGFECIGGFNDHHVPVACEAFLKRRHERPFLLFASFDNPHNICEHSRDQCLPWGEVEDVHPSAYPNLPANFAPGPFEARVLNTQRRTMPPEQFGYTTDRWRRYRHVYYRLCEKVDAQIGRILAALDASGHADNTVVVLLSDHGDHAGAHGLIQKSTAYEESARVPFIVRAPGGARGEVSRLLVSAGIDLLPTLLDYVGAGIPEEAAGLSLRRAVENPGLAGRDWPRDAVVIESRLDRTEIEQRTLCTARYKYTLYDRGLYREMLFDLETDPGEMVNLAVEERYAPVLQAHRRRLYEWCLATGDRFGSHYSHAPHPVIPGIGFSDAPARAGAVGTSSAGAGC